MTRALELSLAIELVTDISIRSVRHNYNTLKYTCTTISTWLYIYCFKVEYTYDLLTQNCTCNLKVQHLTKSNFIWNETFVSKNDQSKRLVYKYICSISCVYKSYCI